MVRNKQPRSLITGGSGFLGSHLCDRLISEGHDVICVDSLITGSENNIKHIVDHPNFTFFHHDVTKPIDLPHLARRTNHAEGDLQVDYVLHFASPASPTDYARYPIHTLKVGAMGTYHALGLAKTHGATFLLASSSEVYGDPQVSPQSEEYYGHVNPVGPRSVYDEAKRFAEALASAYRHSHGLDVRIARLFNTYGPRMRIDDGRAVPTFMAQAIRGEPLTVHGNGSQTRSFCYVDDTVDGVYRLLTYRRVSSSSPVTATQHGERAEDDLIVNIGNPEEIPVLQVAKEVIKVTGSSSTINFAPLPEDDPKTRKPDISRARQLLGWEPLISRKEGLERLVKYFRVALEKAPV